MNSPTFLCFAVMFHLVHGLHRPRHKPAKEPDTVIGTTAMKTYTATTLAAAALLAAAPGWAALRVTALYPLADTAEKLSFGWSPLTWDPQAGELYVVDKARGTVDVFNDNGMLVYSFGDAAVGQITSVVTLEDGSLLVLANKDSVPGVVRCNFRGEFLGRVELAGVPARFAEGFRPEILQVARERIYLADKATKQVLVTGLDGVYETYYDLSQLSAEDGRARGNDEEMRGFSVASDGTMLFTVAGLFRAFVVSPTGQARGFGAKGSVPGKFGVVGGIVADESGHLFVADTLRAVVLVFDRETLSFIGEFGGSGPRAARVVNPLELAVGNGRVYVTQSIGPVKVFGVSFD